MEIRRRGDSRPARFKRVAGWLALFLLPCAGYANEPSLLDIVFDHDPIWTFSIENDAFLNTDRNFTNGLRLDVADTVMQANNMDVKHFVSDDGREYKLKAGLHLANNIYTSEDIRLFPDEISPTDRPYAGLTYIGVSKLRTYEDDSSARWEASIGCVGPCAGSRNIQTEFHELINSAIPQGWSTQIHDDVMLQWSYDRHLPIKGWMKQENAAGDRYLDFSPSWHVEIGTIFDSVGIGGTLRLGKLDSYFRGRGMNPSNPKMLKPDRPEGTITNNNNQPAVSLLTRPPGARIERYLFVRAKARLMLYNATIEGGMFNDSSPFTQDLHHGVFDLEAGVSWGFKRWTLNVFYASRSTEVKAQPFQWARHRWAGIQITR